MTAGALAAARALTHKRGKETMAVIDSHQHFWDPSVTKAALERCLSGLAATERAAVMGGSAIDAYRLRIPAR